jgi:hypothetical protein
MERVGSPSKYIPSEHSKGGAPANLGWELVGIFVSGGF